MVNHTIVVVCWFFLVFCLFAFSSLSSPTCYTDDNVWLSIFLPQWHNGLFWLPALIVQREEKSVSTKYLLCQWRKSFTIEYSSFSPPPPPVFQRLKKAKRFWWVVAQYHHYSVQINIQPSLKHTVFKAWIFCHFHFLFWTAQESLSENK